MYLAALFGHAAAVEKLLAAGAAKNAMNEVRGEEGYGMRVGSGPVATRTSSCHFCSRCCDKSQATLPLFTTPLASFHLKLCWKCISAIADSHRWVKRYQHHLGQNSCVLFSSFGASLDVFVWDGAGRSRPFTWGCVGCMIKAIPSLNKNVG